MADGFGDFMSGAYGGGQGFDAKMLAPLSQGWQGQWFGAPLKGMREGMFGEVPGMASVNDLMAPFGGAVGDPAAQAAFLSQLQQGAQGRGPSAAALMMTSAQDRNAAQAMGMARSQAGMGGVSAGSALRNAMNAGQQSGLQSMQQIGAVRAQEQLAQQQQLGQFLTSLRQQDIERQKAEAEALARSQELQYKPYEIETQQQGAVLGGVGGGLGAAASDRRLKCRIKRLARSIYERIGLKGYSWTWNKDAAKRFGLVGEAGGVIAQEVREKYPEAVIETPDGVLMVRYGYLNDLVLRAL